MGVKKSKKRDPFLYLRRALKLTPTELHVLRLCPYDKNGTVLYRDRIARRLQLEGLLEVAPGTFWCFRITDAGERVLAEVGFLERLGKRSRKRAGR